jgi:hypothetical protein
MISDFNYKYTLKEDLDIKLNQSVKISHEKEFTRKLNESVALLEQNLELD